MNILIAEDSQEARTALFNIIRFSFGDEMTIYQAENGEEAFDIIQTHPIEILLTDIMMPKMDGFTLIQKIRADPKFSNLFIAVITGLSGEEHIDKVYKIGADYYVSKPIHQEDIIARLKLIVKLVKKEQATPQIQRGTLNPFGDEGLKNFYTIYTIYQEDDLYQLIEHINKLFSVNDSISIKDLITIFIKSYETLDPEFEAAFEIMLECSDDKLYITTMSAAFIAALEKYNTHLPDDYFLMSTQNSLTIQIPIHQTKDF